MYFTVDRIEENFVVLVNDSDGSVSEVSVSLLYDAVREGDVIRYDDGEYFFEKELTLERKDSISSRFDRLKKKFDSTELGKRED